MNDHQARLPRALRPGDAVEVIAPSSPFDREKFERGMQALRDLGLLPRHRDDLFAREGHLAGGDDRRLEELQNALHSDAKAIVLARGGYGLLRLASRLPRELPPRLLLGYSDATVLHEAFARTGLPSIHGPMLTQLGADPQEVERLRALLFDPAPPPPIRFAAHAVVSGRARGPLRGGNLASLASLCGTPLQPRFRGALVLLEDLNEPPYRLDRLLTQLLLSGAFEGAHGFVIGDLTGPGESPAGRIEAVAERLAPLQQPLVFGAPFGHAGRNHPVAFGVLHELDASGGELTQLGNLTVA